MMRCFIDTTDWEKSAIRLSREESHHLLSVLRARRGNEISLMDGSGWTARAELISAKDNDATVRIVPGTMVCTPRPPMAITLAQAIPKHSMMDEIIQKATELGVSSIVPLLTERVIVRLDAKTIRARGERWLRIAKEAAKQSGAPWQLDVQPVCRLEELQSRLPGKGSLLLLASLEKNAASLQQALAGIDRKRTEHVILIVGPEGDFTEMEYAMLRSAGAVPVSFGPLVLRVETAAFFGISVLSNEFATPPNVTE